MSQDCVIQPQRKEPSKKYTVMISDPVRGHHAAAACPGTVPELCELFVLQAKGGAIVCTLGFDAGEVFDDWLDALACATVTYGWPGMCIDARLRFRVCALSLARLPPNPGAVVGTYRAVKTVACV